MAMRGISLLLAVCLAILWACGLNLHATAWLTWLVALCAVGGLVVASSGDEEHRHGAAYGSLAVAGGLGVLWIVGLATRREAWLVWWIFGFGCAYLVVAIGGLVAEHPRVVRHERPHAV